MLASSRIARKLKRALGLQGTRSALSHTVWAIVTTS
jgi:hypothetical protein